MTQARPDPIWWVTRWAPLFTTVLFASALLVRAGTDPLDLLRYAAYVILSVIMPGTLVYRSLRRTPHTLVEDLAMGAAVGLCLELAAWALFSVLDLRSFVWLWPALVAVPFALVPRLRRHWWVREYRPVPLGWSWAIAGVVCFWTAYLAMVFLDRNPIVPTSDGTQQYLDLAYQLSLAGEAKHAFPVGLPQVAGEPLYYHWFAYGHMAMSSLVGHIDLPVVAMRFAIPALCALAIVLTGVVGWRLSGRPGVGAVAAALFFAVGEFNFTHPVTMPFGTQATFVIWHGMSMIYSWVLLIAAIAPLGEIAGQKDDRVPPVGRGAFGVAALLLFASSGAKASSLPVIALALAATAVVMLIVRRRIPWGLILAGVIAGAAQLFATAVLFHFQTYGLEVDPLQGLRGYWAGPDGTSLGPLTVAMVWVAFGLNMLLRTAGILPLLWLRRFNLEPGQWFLLFGAIAGPGIYLVVGQPSGGNQYFTRAGFAFGVILSAWGYVMVYDRARLPQAAAWALGAGALVVSVALVVEQIRYAWPPPSTGDAFQQLVPLLLWARLLLLVGIGVGVVWVLLGLRFRALSGRGAIVALTFVLIAGAPGLIMDEYKSIQSPNGGAYALVGMPASRTNAARWVRDHSDPDDVVATNAHCLGYWGDLCDSRSFWLSAYSERSVLVEGWGFAPRESTGMTPFWDPDKLALNDQAFTAPTVDVLNQLRNRYGVRWLVVDRVIGQESRDLASMAPRVYDNGRIAVYHIP
jgi:hypothetical protein